MQGYRTMINRYAAKPATALIAAALIAMSGTSPAQSQSLSDSTMSLNASHWPSVGDIRVIALESVFDEIVSLREVGISELAWANDRSYASLAMDDGGVAARGTFRLSGNIQIAQLSTGVGSDSSSGNTPRAMDFGRTPLSGNAGSFFATTQLAGLTTNIKSPSSSELFSTAAGAGNGNVRLVAGVNAPSTQTVTNNAGSEPTPPVNQALVPRTEAEFNLREAQDKYYDRNRSYNTLAGMALTGKLNTPALVTKFANAKIAKDIAYEEFVTAQDALYDSGKFSSLTNDSGAGGSDQAGAGNGGFDPNFPYDIPVPIFSVTMLSPEDAGKTNAQLLAEGKDLGIELDSPEAAAGQAYIDSFVIDPGFPSTDLRVGTPDCGVGGCGVNSLVQLQTGGGCDQAVGGCSEGFGNQEYYINFTTPNGRSVVVTGYDPITGAAIYYEPGNNDDCGSDCTSDDNTSLTVPPEEVGETAASDLASEYGVSQVNSEGSDLEYVSIDNEGNATAHYDDDTTEPATFQGDDVLEVPSTNAGSILKEVSDYGNGRMVATYQDGTVLSYGLGPMTDDGCGGGGCEYKVDLSDCGVGGCSSEAYDATAFVDDTGCGTSTGCSADQTFIVIDGFDDDGGCGSSGTCDEELFGPTAGFDDDAGCGFSGTCDGSGGGYDQYGVTSSTAFHPIQATTLVPPGYENYTTAQLLALGMDFEHDPSEEGSECAGGTCGHPGTGGNVANAIFISMLGGVAPPPMGAPLQQFLVVPIGSTAFVIPIDNGLTNGSTSGLFDIASIINQGGISAAVLQSGGILLLGIPSIANIISGSYVFDFLAGDHAGLSFFDAGGGSFGTSNPDTRIFFFGVGNNDLQFFSLVSGGPATINVTLTPSGFSGTQIVINGSVDSSGGAVQLIAQ